MSERVVKLNIPLGWPVDWDAPLITAAEALDLGIRVADLSVADALTGCRNWTGHADGGYGRVGFRGQLWLVHRLVYIVSNGPIGDLEIDHLCRNTYCCALSHLEAVPGVVNKKRAKAALTACKWGHEYTAENLLVDPRGHRRCRACNRRTLRLRQIRKARKPEVQP